MQRQWGLIFKFRSGSVTEMTKCYKILCIDSCKFVGISSTPFSGLEMISWGAIDIVWVLLSTGGTPSLETEETELCWF